MARSRIYTVFVSGHGEAGLWEQMPSVEASSMEAAIEKVRNGRPDFKANTDLLYFAVAGFDPRTMEKELIEKWSLIPLSKTPAAKASAEKTREMEIDA